MSNISIFNLPQQLPEILPLECDTSFDTSYDLLSYFWIFIYLGIGLVSHGYTLISILITRKKIFKESSFFQIFAVDSVASIILILDELCFTHFFLFIYQFCPIVGPFFWTHTIWSQIILKFVYVSINHARFMKALAQIVMVLNRMSCVIMIKPGKYEQMWKKFTPTSCLLISILPFAGTWNLIISRTVAVTQRGGISLGYEKIVKWASISLFQSISLLTALGFTIICTSITLYKLILLKNRIKSAERSLCLTSICISITFLLAAGTQSIVMILFDVFFGRLFLYVSSLCPIVGPYFWNSTFILRIYYFGFMHARFTKPVVQIFMALNRMTCVLTPTYYFWIWTRLTPIAIAMIIIVPFGGTWYILLSPRFYAVSGYGGFSVNYIRAVPWASASMFQSIYVLTALGFTIVCTTITLYKLVFLNVRVKAAEKSLCFTSIFISFTFLLVAGTQLFYIVCVSCRSSDYLFTCQFLAFDCFTVGSAAILLFSNRQLRESIFPPKANQDRVFRVSANNSFTQA